MRCHPFRPFVVLLAISLAISVPATAVSGQDLEDVTRQREQLQEEVEASLRRLEDLEATIAEADESIEQFEVERGELVAAAEAAQERLQDRARRMYMTGQLDPAMMLLTAQRDDFVDRLSLVTILDQRDQASWEANRTATVRLAQLNELLIAQRDTLDSAREEMLKETDALQTRLDRTVLQEQDLRSRRERQQFIDRGVQAGIYSCIFDPAVTYFIDSWGYPRSGGRRHKGTDVMAPRGVNVYAITDGRISRLKSGGLGGIVAYLEGDDGVRYYYAHLQGYVDGLRVGQRVEAGELIAFNGDCGNARGGATHVHLQVHPGGGGPVNPYPWLRAVC